VIRILAVAEQFHAIDASSNQPPQIGDRLAFSGSFYRWAGRDRGRRIGSFEALATVTSRRWSYFTATGVLSGGSILVAGRMALFDVPIERYAVIGGTGRYAGASGTLTVRVIRNTNNAALVFRLRT
jgi:hypothetical protein